MRKIWGAFVLGFLAAPAVAILPPPPSEEGRDGDAQVIQGRAGGSDRDPRNFSVQGADLRSRHATALEHAGDRQIPAFWIAYSIEPAPEIGPELVADSVGGPGACGSSEGTASRRVVLLLRYAPHQAWPDALELCHIERPRDDGRRVAYWIGRATLHESFDLLERLSRSPALQATADGLVRALRLHESARAIPKLRELARRSPFADVRARAAVALAAFPRQAQFLASLVLDPRQEMLVRARVAAALGESRDADTSELVRDLSTLISDPMVQRGLAEALARLSGDRAARPVTTSSLMGGYSPLKGGVSSLPRGIAPARR